MEKIIYLCALLVSLAGICVIDWRYKLVLFHDLKVAAKCLLLGVLFFVIWDLLGIHLGIFYEGQSRFMTHWMVAPHMPIEELFFLTLLVYLPLVLWEYLDRVRHV